MMPPTHPQYTASLSAGGSDSESPVLYGGIPTNDHGKL